MPLAAKVCPIISRTAAHVPEVLAFEHPLAGRQFMKGGVKPGEAPVQAAHRELFEESGLRIPQDIPAGLRFCSTIEISGDTPAQHTAPAKSGSLGQNATPIPTLWHLFHGIGHSLADHWHHDTLDDHGHRFAFFWHPLNQPLDSRWDPLFHKAFIAIRDVLR